MVLAANEVKLNIRENKKKTFLNIIMILNYLPTKLRIIILEWAKNKAFCRAPRGGRASDRLEGENRASRRALRALLSANGFFIRIYMSSRARAVFLMISVRPEEVAQATVSRGI